MSEHEKGIAEVAVDAIILDLTWIGRAHIRIYTHWKPAHIPEPPKETA